MVLVLRKGASKAEIEALRKQLEVLRSERKGVDTRKYCGVLKLKEDPMEIQRRMRDEWR